MKCFSWCLECGWSGDGQLDRCPDCDGGTVVVAPMGDLVPSIGIKQVLLRIGFLLFVMVLTVVVLLVVK